MAEKLLLEQVDEAEALGGLDPDAAEAAGLAHDLGHPPFGHLAEKALDRLCQERGLADGFEGNAQSFRIVTRLATGDAFGPDADPIDGLNLTRATLNGILKYPWLHGKNQMKPRKWGAYEAERELFEWVRRGQPYPANAKSVEAELMDWADDITYSVHDMLDFYCAGQIPLDRLAQSESKDRGAFLEEVFERERDLVGRRQDLEAAFNDMMTFVPFDSRYTGSRQQRYAVWQLTTSLISKYVEAIKLTPGGTSAVTIAPWARDEIAMLKQLTWHYVILRSDLGAHQEGQEHAVRKVFEVLHDYASATVDRHRNVFPPFYGEQLRQADGERNRITRIVADYVSGMTEREVLSTYSAFTGRGIA